MPKLVLHDLATRAPQSCWSLNPWKTRLLLNFKGIDYETNWVEYPDIPDLLKDNVPENPEGSFKPYTIPAVTFPDGTWMQDSRTIATAIEKQQPEPTLNLDSPYQARIEAAVPKFMLAVYPILFNQVPKHVLTDASIPFWLKDRSDRAGMDLEEFEKQKGGEVAYTAAAPVINEVTAMLKENEGPFFAGNTVSYADFVWLSVLLCMKRINPDFYEGVISKSDDRSVHDNLLVAGAGWSKRNDH